MGNTLLPVVGASLKIKDLPEHLDWLVSAQRDLEIWDPSVGDFLDSDWKPLATQVRSLLEGYSGRLGIHGPWDGLPLIARDPKVRNLVIDRLKQALEFAAVVGATQMVLHSPFEFYGSPQVAHTFATGLTDEIELVHRVMQDVLPMAGQMNCELALEMCYDTHPLPLITLVRSFAGGGVRLSLDTGHALIMQRIGGPPAEQWVREAGSLLAHLHLEDNDGAWDHHWGPGEGKVGWGAIFAALQTLDQQPRLILEVESAKIRRGADWLARQGFVR